VPIQTFKTLNFDSRVAKVTSSRQKRSHVPLLPSRWVGRIQAQAL